MKLFKKLVITIVAFFVTQILFLFVLFLLIIASVKGDSETPGLPEKAILELDLSTPMPDKVSPALEIVSLINKAPKQLGFLEVLNAVQKAQSDPKIKALSLKFPLQAMSLANTQELRRALLEFKKSGKPIFAYANNFDQKSYYLASVADSSFMHPMGTFMLKGLLSKRTFFKQAIEKIGANTHIIRSGKYKAAIEPFSRTKMSPESRQQTKELLQEIWGQIASDLSQSRGMTEKELNTVVSEMKVTSADDAVQQGFIEAALYTDQYQEKLKKFLQEDELETVSIADYSAVQKVQQPLAMDKDSIAVLYAQGEIVMQANTTNQISVALAEQIKRVREDASIKALVLRVNSPGGSAHASDIIWREVALTAKKKTVVASFGGVAASGGYYIACAANKIVAENTTVTGSIGVFGVLFSGQKLYEDKLGLNFDTYKTHPHADFMSGSGVLPLLTEPLKPHEHQLIKKFIDQIYDRFTNLVADGRGKSQAQVHKIAQGRVWSGEKAHELGLVDSIGGLQAAIELAAQEAELEDYQVVNVHDDEDLLSKISSMMLGVKHKIAASIFGIEHPFLLDAKKFLQNRGGIQARLPYELLD